MLRARRNSKAVVLNRTVLAKAGPSVETASDPRQKLHDSKAFLCETCTRWMGVRLGSVVLWLSNTKETKSSILTKFHI